MDKLFLILLSFSIVACGDSSVSKKKNITHHSKELIGQKKDVKTQEHTLKNTEKLNNNKVHITKNSLAVSVCDRTSTVKYAIVYLLQKNYNAQTKTINDIINCADITQTDLLEITNLTLVNKSIVTLKKGDFSGLKNLITLDLSRNRLSNLPKKMFSEANLPELEELNLEKNLFDEIFKRDFKARLKQQRSSRWFSKELSLLL